MNPTLNAAQIAALEEKLNQLHAKISYVDHSVSDFANKHMRNYTFQGKEVSPEEIAKQVLSKADEHQLLDDDLPANDFETNFPFDETPLTFLPQPLRHLVPPPHYTDHSRP